MRTTLDLEDALFREAKTRAAERGEPLTRLIEKALRRYLREADAPVVPFRFGPLIKAGRALPGIDWDDRDALVERMEERS